MPLESILPRDLYIFSYRELSDSDLISCLKKNDDRAFREVYDRYWSMLYEHASKMLDQDEAQDVVQELFICIWQRRHTILLNGCLSGYLHVAVRNKILNVLRKKKSDGEFMNRLAFHLETFENGIVNNITEKELTRAIDGEIEKLPGKMKNVFEMSRKQHLSHKQIAAELNISDKTVKKHVGNAIRIIRFKLGL